MSRGVLATAHVAVLLLGCARPLAAISPSDGREAEKRTKCIYRKSPAEALSSAVVSASVGADGSVEAGAPSCEWPKVVIGCWQVDEMAEDQDLATETLTGYMMAGFTTFDTADGWRRSEMNLGQVQKLLFARLTKYGSSPTIHSKYGMHEPPSSEDIDLIRAALRTTRQKTGAVPELVALHWYDFSSPATHLEAAKNLEKLRAEEKLVRQIGLVNYDTHHMAEVVEAGVPIVSNQVQYSVLDQRPENGVLGYAKRHGIQIAAYGTVAGGWLTDDWLGEVEPGHEWLHRADESSRGGFMTSISLRMYKGNLNRWSGGKWDKFQQLLVVMRAVADRHNSTIASVASAWVQYQLRTLGAGGWVIIGVRNLDHIREHMKLHEVRLEAEDDEAIRKVLATGHVAKHDIWSFEREGVAYSNEVEQSQKPARKRRGGIRLEKLKRDDPDYAGRVYEDESLDTSGLDPRLAEYVRPRGYRGDDPNRKNAFRASQGMGTPGEDS